MCTAIAKRGKDVIYGFNLDVDPAVWNYGIYKTKNYFTVGITAGKTVYFTHGVNSRGNFGNVPYMNGARFPVPKGAKRERIDLLSDRFIRGKYSWEDVVRITQTKTLVNVPAATLHSLLGNGNGEFLIAEPGYGVKTAEEDYAVLANFPVLANLTDFSNPFYGKARYDRALAALQSSGADFSVRDALAILADAGQGGKWGTKVSFVWSRNESTVYWCENGDFNRVETHRLCPPKNA